MTVRRISIALLALAIACGGDDKKDEDKKADDQKAKDGIGGQGLMAGGPTGPISASPGGAAPARSLFGGKLAGIFGKATQGATPQTAGDLSQIFGNSTPTLTPALAGVSGSSGAAPAAPAAASNLWAFAPADAAFGIVAVDGSLKDVVAAADGLRDVVAKSPMGVQVIQMMKASAAATGFDPTDLNGWAAHAGVDLSKGFAMFASTTGNVVVVLPVSDAKAFRTAVKDDEGNLDDNHCVTAQGRYVCAPNKAYAQAAAASHDSPLAKRAGQLPAWLHGDIELVTHLASFPGAVQELAQLNQMMTDIGTLAVALNLDAGSVSVRAWLEGKRGGPIGDAFASIPAATLNDESAGATNFFHIRTPWSLITAMAPMPPSLPIGPGVDLRADIIDNLTGEMVTYSRGKDFLSEHIALGIKDPARAAKAVELMCDLGGQAKVINGIKKGPGACSGTIKLGEMLAENPDLKPFVQGMPPVPVMAQVNGAKLEIKVGWPGPATGQAADNAGNDIARELMTGNWHFVMWGMGFDPLGVLPAVLQKRVDALLSSVPPDAAQGIAMARWIYGHVYDTGIAWALREDGMYLLAEVTTYGGDPDGAYTAHQDALTALVNRDYAGYKRKSADLAKSFPQSLAGRHGAHIAQGTSMLGQFGVWGLFGAVGALAGKREAKAVDPDMMPPPPMRGGKVDSAGGGSFDLDKAVKAICACKDMACVQAKAAQFASVDPTSIDQAKLQAASMKMQKCVQKIAIESGGK